MSDKLTSLAGEALAQAMETMAFIAALPAEQPCQLTAPAVMVSLPFRGPVCGVVELVAGRELGQMLADNILAGEAGSAPASESAGDALKELLNITCGSLFSQLSPGSASYDISLPRLSAFDSQKDWNAFIADSGASVLDADGSIVAIRVKEGQKA